MRDADPHPRSGSVRELTISFGMNAACEHASRSCVEYPRLQHPPCPQCDSKRTINTATSELARTLYCPDCGYTWQHAIKSVKERVNPQNAGSRRTQRTTPAARLTILTPDRDRQRLESNMFDLSTEAVKRIEDEWNGTALKQFLDSQRGVKTPPDYPGLHLTAREFAHAKLGYGKDGSTLKVEEARRAIEASPKRSRRAAPSKH